MNKFKKYGLLIFITIFMCSCEKWIDTDLNTDPSNPEDVPMNLLLSSSQVAIAYQVGGDISRPQAMWMQQLAGVDRQSLAHERYTFTESDINNTWRWGFYSGPLMNLNVLMKKAAELNAPHYAGVAKVLNAYSLGVMTDVWNDMPYSEAFLGDKNFTPKFDKQSDIYNSIISLLDAAIIDLSSTTPLIALKGDVIYGNSAAKWKKAAYSIKVRATLHLSKVNGYAPVITALNAGTCFESNADDFQVKFGTNALESAPYFQFQEQRGDIRVGKLLVDTMNSMNDPRRDKYFTKVGVGGNFVGSGPGEGLTGASNVGTYHGSNNSPVELMSYIELKFIEAEAKFETGDAPGAATAFNLAVKASLSKMSITDTVYANLYAKETGSSLTKGKIMLQKYIALYLQPEVWSDWRRTNWITFKLPANASKNQVPRRYPYAASEKQYNAANVPAITILDRVWWDKP